MPGKSPRNVYVHGAIGSSKGRLGEPNGHLIGRAPLS